MIGINFQGILQEIIFLGEILTIKSTIEMVQFICKVTVAFR